MSKRLRTLFAAAVLPFMAVAQEGTLTGDLQTNVNFFMRDSSIGAYGNPLYDNYLSGGEAWLTLRYNVKDWTFFLRTDAFNNSNLYNPTQALTRYGIGAFSITKEMGDLTVIGGYIYDQIGSGLLFRSYEDRGLLIDNSLVGLELKYKLTDNINLKGFSGQQKFLLDKYAPIIKGFNAEGNFTVKGVHLMPGVGVLNRTLDQDTYDNVKAQINGLSGDQWFPLKHNMVAATFYNTLDYKGLTWYAEGAVKSKDAIKDINGDLIDTAGTAFFTTLSYAKKGIGITVSGKRTENFSMRVTPNNQLLNGMLNWQPIVARLRPERVVSRYSPPSQDLSEMAATVDVLYSPNDVSTFTFTYTNINKLDNTRLYRELYGEYVYQGPGNVTLQGGIQYMEYNRTVYQAKLADYVYAITPFAEVTYKFTETRSLRFETQYMHTKQDYGSWIFALLEYNVAPKISLWVSDMYNVDPKDPGHFIENVPAIHYYSVAGAFSKGPHRFSIAYTKQVAGMNCSGGVCRYEPAFNGVKSTFVTSF